MKVALVHDWLDGYRGGEKVLEAFMELYPDAPIFTLFLDRQAMPESFQSREIIISKALKPFSRWRKALLPLLPMAIENFPLENYDLVISSSSCVAKGVITSPDATHVCYIHSPMRYIWDQREHYTGKFSSNAILGPLVSWMSHKLRIWDVSSSQRVDNFVANSQFVAKRVSKYYGRRSEVLAPPVEVEDIIADGAKQQAFDKKDYFLAAGAFVSYKRFDLAIEASNRSGKRLIVAGSGEEESKLRKMAGPSVEFIIRPDRERWLKLFREAQAFVFPGVEDFGITAIESLASGTPIIAYQKGGALDFVVPNRTGVFFASDTVDSLVHALESFKADSFKKQDLQEFARSFAKDKFKQHFQDIIARSVASDQKKKD